MSSVNFRGTADADATGPIAHHAGRENHAKRFFRVRPLKYVAQALTYYVVLTSYIHLGPGSVSSVSALQERTSLKGKKHCESIISMNGR